MPCRFMMRMPAFDEFENFVLQLIDQKPIVFCLGLIILPIYERPFGDCIVFADGPEFSA